MRRKRIDHDKDYIVSWASDDARDSAYIYMQCWPVDSGRSKTVEQLTGHMWQLMQLWHDIDQQAVCHGEWLDMTLAANSQMWQYINMREAV